MKNRGLINRFPPGVRESWMGHYDCMICNKNCWDCLHHIISPSNPLFVPGDHNKSILNSAPIHNFAHPLDVMKMKKNHYCHFGNEAFLHQKDTTVAILHKVYRALLAIGYRLNERDNRFLQTYAPLYLMETPNVLSEAEGISVHNPVENLFATSI